MQEAVASRIMIAARGQWPPSRVFQLHATESPHHAPTLLFTWPPPRPQASQGIGDGFYDADEYADLMRGVDMDPSKLTTKPGDLRTNCTTRFGTKHVIRTEGCYREVNSVFIPYGSVVFACFQTQKTIPLPSAVKGPQPQAQAPMASSPVVASGGSDWRPAAPSGPSGDGYENYASTSGAFPREYGAPAGFNNAAPYGQSLGYGRVGDAAPTPPRPSGSSSRPLVRPPGDVEKCRGCGTRESPEWRKGENGVKDLCNACGLKLARAVAKREGRQKPRKKDKT